MSGSTGSLGNYIPSPKEIKQRRRMMTTICAYCKKTEELGGCPFKTCAKCKSVPYCSRECQKSDWPRHKKPCGEHIGFLPDLTKFVQTMLANDMLRHYVMVLLVLELDLVDYSMDSQVPLAADIIIDFEPTNSLDLLDLFHSSAKIDSRPMQGMLQICAVIGNKGRDGFTDLGGYQTGRYTEEARLRTALLGDHEENKLLDSLPVVTVQFLRSVDGRFQVTSTAFNIPEEAIDFCRQIKELEIPLEPNPEGFATKKVSTSSTAYTELINELIQEDTKNRWLLRMNMQEKDKQAIKDAANAEFPDVLGTFVKDNARRRLTHALLAVPRG